MTLNPRVARGGGMKQFADARSRTSIVWTPDELTALQSLFSDIHCGIGDHDADWIERLPNLMAALRGCVFVAPPARVVSLVVV